MGSVTFSAILTTAEHPHLAVVEFAGVVDPVCTTADPGMVIVPFIRGYS